MRPAHEPVPYAGEDYSADVYSGPTDARPPVAFDPGEEPQYDAEPAPLPWYKRPPILFGAAAVAALLAIGGLAITLTGNSGVLGPVTETSTTFSLEPTSGAPPTSVEPTTVTVTGSDGQPTTTIVTPPPPPPSSSTTTTTSPTTTIEHDDDHHHHNHHDNDHHDNDDDHHDDDFASGAQARAQARARNPPADGA